jgi:hypothetical protein
MVDSLMGWWRGTFMAGLYVPVSDSASSLNQGVPMTFQPRPVTLLNMDYKLLTIGLCEQVSRNALDNATPSEERKNWIGLTLSLEPFLCLSWGRKGGQSYCELNSSILADKEFLPAFSMEMAGLDEVRDSAMLAADWWEEEADLSGTFVITFLKSGLTGWERPCISCNWVWSWPWLARDEGNTAEDGGNAGSEEETGSARARLDTFLGWGGDLPLADVDRRKVAAQEAIKKANGTTLRDLMEVMEEVFLFLQGPLPELACSSRQPPNASGFWSSFSVGFLNQTFLQASRGWHKQR